MGVAIEGTNVRFTKTVKQTVVKREEIKCSKCEEKLSKDDFPLHAKGQPYICYNCLGERTKDELNV